MLSSESSSDECLPHKQLTRLTSGTEGLSNCESELSVAFEVPDYIESSESELEDSEHASEPQLTLEKKLAAWKREHSITRSALDDLLMILRSEGHRVPKDGRTLLKTP